jgi:hypothetical protein
MNMGRNTKILRAGGHARAGLSALALFLMLGATPALSGADSGTPFVISVDGQRVDGSTLPGGSAEEKGALQVDVKFDGLGITPQLNVSTVPARVTFQAGDEIEFKASLNYAAWVSKAEVWLFERGKRRAKPLHTLELDGEGIARWEMPADGPDKFEYILRVYDAEGRFDETKPLPLARAAAGFDAKGNEDSAKAAAYSEDRTAIRNITLSGGAVTVFGRNVPAGHQVFVAGEQATVDPEGNFVIQRVYPSGQHIVEIEVQKDGKGLNFTREVDIPDQEWFYVGLADFIAGYRWGDHVEEAGEGEFEERTYTKGRLAFYLKGKVKGEWILTAAADTSEKQLKNIFKGLDEKDPRQFLKRIDPDDYYPVYGDDSTAVEDAPTQGKFYVKLQRGNSHVMWGNFKSNITGSEFIRNDRALYGAQGVLKTGGVAPDGDATTNVEVHAALPGTVPQRDVFRGTGGSAYFLKHQDITPGSETVTEEIRNSVTGWVAGRKTLKYGEDYDFDYVQGVIILRKPLPSTTAGAENYLVVQYEFTPAASDVDGYVVGGRAQQWVGDHVRVGVTGAKEKTEGADQKIYGADLRVQHSPSTYIEGEIAQSQGPGFGNTYSPDGGLTLQDNATAGTANRKAKAYRIEAHGDITELTDGKIEGNVEARYEKHEKGFSSTSVNADQSKETWGVATTLKTSENTELKAVYAEEKSGNGSHNREAKANLKIAAGKHVIIEPYFSHVEKDAGSAATATTEQGKRTDAGTKLTYVWDEDAQAYVFAQGTIKRTGTMDRDNRAGIGGKKRISDRITAEGEVSTGTQGIGGAFRVNYEPTVDDRYYIGYELDPSRDKAENWPFKLTGDDIGTIVAGAHKRFNDQWKAYAEDSYDMFGKRRSLMQAYGITFTPDEAWTFTAGAEIGRVFDSTLDSAGLKNPDFDRIALSTAVTYKSEDGFEAAMKNELRIDDKDGEDALYAYLFQASLGIQVSDDWRAIGHFDGVWTDGSATTRDSKYAEGSLGFAYRPTTSDKFNALVKYTYLYDDPGVNQVGVDGTTASPAQRSHIFSADAMYDLNKNLTIGAKYGARIGEIKERVAGASWDESSAHLAVLRADFHVVKNWDALLEGRVLWSPTTDQTDFGLVAAVYRHVNDNFKIGVGYNFGRFSDDLRDLTMDDQGVFLNLIGKF